MGNKKRKKKNLGILESSRNKRIEWVKRGYPNHSREDQLCPVASRERGGRRHMLALSLLLAPLLRPRHNSHRHCMLGDAGFLIFARVDPALFNVGCPRAFLQQVIRLHKEPATPYEQVFFSNWDWGTGAGKLTLTHPPQRVGYVNGLFASPEGQHDGARGKLD